MMVITVNIRSSFHVPGLGLMMLRRETQESTPWSLGTTAELRLSWGMRTAAPELWAPLSDATAREGVLSGENRSLRAES